MSADTVSLVNRLVRAIPELAPPLAEHLQEMDGEMLPHMFFGDVTRWAQDQVSDPRQVDRLLSILEVAHHEEPDDVGELIHVSFLENLDEDSWIWARLGPHLSRAGRQLFDDDPEYFPPGLRRS